MENDALHVDDRHWPDWAFAIISAIHHTEEQLLTKQDQLNDDVQAITSALSSLSSQITDLKAQLASQVPDTVDLSGLDSLAEQARALMPQVDAVGSDAPAADTPADTSTPDATDTSAPTEDPSVTPPPNLNA